MNSVLSATALSKHYGKQAAVDAIDLDIQPGRIVGLIGPNGSGKTTTLKAALGLIPFEGELKVMGFDPRTQRDDLMREVCIVSGFRLAGPDEGSGLVFVADEAVDGVRIAVHPAPGNKCERCWTIATSVGQVVDQL